MTDTQKIFALAGKENYIEPDCYTPVKWPSDTWLQRRRRELAQKEGRHEGL